MTIYMVGGWTNPFEKYYVVKLGQFPQVGVKIKDVLNHQLATFQITTQL